MVDLPQGPYQVVLLWSAKHQLREAVARASTPGSKRQFLDQVKEIVARLTVDPLTWGDPLRKLVNAGLVQCHRLQDMILAGYAVDEAHKIVYVKEIRPVLGHPLAPS